MLKLQFKDTPERGLWLVGDRIRLGSHKSNDVVLSSPSAKDFHAEISIEPKCVVLISEPGSCFVNNLPVDGEYQLAVDDEIRLGSECLVLIDPKQSVKDEDYALLTPSNALETVAVWELLPAHAKLKDRNFLIKQAAILGRARDCDFSVPYKLLSRHHARFDLQNGDLILEDLESANGCTVNGQRVQRALLKHGDRIAFARLTFTVKGPVTAEGPEVRTMAPGVIESGVIGFEDIESEDIKPQVLGSGLEDPVDKQSGDALITSASGNEVGGEKAPGREKGADKRLQAGPRNTEPSVSADSASSSSVMTGRLALDKGHSAIERQLARSVSNGTSTEQEQGNTMVPAGQQYSRSLYLAACFATCLLVITWQIIGQ